MLSWNKIRDLEFFEVFQHTMGYESDVLTMNVNNTVARGNEDHFIFIVSFHL